MRIPNLLSESRKLLGISSYLQKTGFEFYPPKKFSCSVQVRDMIEVTSKMESTHQIVPASNFLDGLERVALQKYGPRPFSCSFCENQDSLIFVLRPFCGVYSTVGELCDVHFHPKSR